MPIHNFICKACNISIQDTTTKGAHNCPECGEEMWCPFGGGIGGHYDRPIHSDSLAINPCQVKEHREKFPNIDLDSQCRPVFDNYTDHEAYLKATGFVKPPQKIRNKGKRIKTLKAT